MSHGAFKTSVSAVYTCKLILIILIQCSQAEFSEYPTNITQRRIGSPAVFRCEHQSTDAGITWRINGSSPAQFTNVTSVTSGNFGTLTILSIPEYDGIEVVCRAFIIIGEAPVLEQTPPVTLTVKKVNFSGEHLQTASSPTTTAATTTVTNFITVPSPPVLIVPAEERYVYMCNHSEKTANIFWRVNGSRLLVDIFPVGIVSDIIDFPLAGGRVSTLTIGGRLEHNGTTIQCSAQLGERYTVSTPSVLFLMQGLLQSVDKLERRNDAIVWKAPFSLNLTDVEPDIVYCVEVYNITCGRGQIISDCDVTETSYISDIIALDGYIYEYIVSPRSNVEGTQNGASKKVTEQFINLQLSTLSLIFSFNNNTDVNDSTDLQAVKTMIHLNVEEKETLNPVNAASYSLTLNPLDGVGGDIILKSTTAIRNGSSVILKVSLPFRRLWNYTVLANGCEEHPLMETNELSTHDIQNISVTSSQPGEVRVTGDFTDGSTATGLLTIIVISTSEIYHLIERGSGELHIEGAIQGVVGGEHSISFFVVEESGLPFNRTISIPKVVSVENSNDVKQVFDIEYSVTPTYSDSCNGVFITCIFLNNSSTTDCVVVVRERILQLSSSGLMNIKSSHKFTRSGDTASGCIEGVNMEDYQVGVVGGMIKVSPTDQTDVIFTGHGCVTVACYSGLGGGALAIAVVILLIVIVTIITFIRKRSMLLDWNEGAAHNVALQKCEAYEIVKLSKQKVIMEENPAYGEVGPKVGCIST